MAGLSPVMTHWYVLACRWRPKPEGWGQMYSNSGWRGGADTPGTGNDIGVTWRVGPRSSPRPLLAWGSQGSEGAGDGENTAAS